MGPSALHVSWSRLEVALAPHHPSTPSTPSPNPPADTRRWLLSRNWHVAASADLRFILSRFGDLLTFGPREQEATAVCVFLRF